MCRWILLFGMFVSACGVDGPHGIGEPCAAVEDCMSGLSCAYEDPGGQCIKLCPGHSDAECGDASKYACSAEGHCYIRCNTTADCSRAAEGYACVDDDPPRGVRFCDVAP